MDYEIIKEQNCHEDFIIKFDGQLHQVDTNTLINALINLSTLVQNINQELDPQSKIEIKIRALTQGSFKIHSRINYPENSQDGLFNNGETIKQEHLKKVLTTTTDYLQIDKCLAREDPQRTTAQPENKIEIQGKNGSVVLASQEAFNVYNSNQVSADSTSKTYEALSQDPSIEGLTIEDELGNTLFTTDKEEFPKLATRRTLSESQTKTEVKEAELIVFKVVFADQYKWEFYYLGNKISASITDENFYKEIDSGKRFAKGDKLAVDMEITQLYEPSINAYVNHSYKVIKVKNHIPRKNEQIELEM